MSTYHTPVLLSEVIDGLRVTPGDRYIDATLGGGGHTLAILKRGGVVLSLDADAGAIEFVKKEILAREPEEVRSRSTIAHGNFGDLADLARANGFSEVSGVLFDLGVSSFQLDAPEKGFSYRFEEAPLDMRFDQTSGVTAAEYLQQISEEELYEVIAKYGEEERARQLAHAIISARSVRPLEKTGDLIRALMGGHGNAEASRGMLSRVFQAIRMVVNDEMGSIRTGLAGAYEVLKPGGRVAVISFHSLEDRAVKLTFGKSSWMVVNKKPITATEKEIFENRRARSAKLRIGQKAL